MNGRIVRYERPHVSIGGSTPSWTICPNLSQNLRPYLSEYLRQNLS